MIFAAYAGTGKSYAAEKLNGVLDMAIVPYKYQFPKEYKKEDFTECDKGCIEFPFDDTYPEKYVADVLKNCRNYNHILIPSDNRVMNVLEAQKVEFVLCYPGRCLKEVYRKRYQTRGNAEEFMRIFVDRWDLWIDSFERRSCKKYVMQQREFLKEIIEKYIIEERKQCI